MFLQNSTFAGLGTYSVKVPDTGPYFVDIKSSIPTLVNGGGQSSLVITVNKNSSTTVYTGVAGAEGAKAEFPATAGDIVNVIFSSAATPDQGLNAIKSVISVGSGQ